MVASWGVSPLRVRRWPPAAPPGPRGAVQAGLRADRAQPRPAGHLV